MLAAGGHCRNSSIKSEPTRWATIRRASFLRVRRSRASVFNNTTAKNISSASTFTSVSLPTMIAVLVSKMRALLPQVVYLPLYPAMTETAIDRMAEVVNEVESTGH